MRPSLWCVLAALLVAFIIYLVADPNLDVYAHYNSATHQVQVELTTLSAAHRGARIIRRPSCEVLGFLHPAPAEPLPDMFASGDDSLAYTELDLAPAAILLI